MALITQLPVIRLFSLAAAVAYSAAAQQCATAATRPPALLYLESRGVERKSVWALHPNASGGLLGETLVWDLNATVATVATFTAGERYAYVAAGLTQPGALFTTSASIVRVPLGSAAQPGAIDVLWTVHRDAADPPATPEGVAADEPGNALYWAQAGSPAWLWACEVTQCARTARVLGSFDAGVALGCVQPPVPESLHLYAAGQRLLVRATCATQTGLFGARAALQYSFATPRAPGGFAGTGAPLVVDKRLVYEAPPAVLPDGTTHDVAQGLYLVGLRDTAPWWGNRSLGRSPRLAFDAPAARLWLIDDDTFAFAAQDAAQRWVLQGSGSLPARDRWDVVEVAASECASEGACGDGRCDRAAGESDASCPRDCCPAGTFDDPATPDFVDCRVCPPGTNATAGSTACLSSAAQPAQLIYLESSGLGRKAVWALSPGPSGALGGDRLVWDLNATVAALAVGDRHVYAAAGSARPGDLWTTSATIARLPLALAAADPRGAASDVLWAVHRDSGAYPATPAGLAADEPGNTLYWAQPGPVACLWACRITQCARTAGVLDTLAHEAAAGCVSPPVAQSLHLYDGGQRLLVRATCATQGGAFGARAALQYSFATPRAPGGFAGTGAPLVVDKRLAYALHPAVLPDGTTHDVAQGLYLDAAQRWVLQGSGSLPARDRWDVVEVAASECASEGACGDGRCDRAAGESDASCPRDCCPAGTFDDPATPDFVDCRVCPPGTNATAGSTACLSSAAPLAPVPALLSALLPLLLGAVAGASS
eukprot:m51a1_g10240 hypothetical protein (770) ;mRNA; f:23997-27169